MTNTVKSQKIGTGEELSWYQSRSGERGQRFEYWGALRALCSPTFLRSTFLESRVTKPAFRSAGLRLSS